MSGVWLGFQVVRGLARGAGHQMYGRHPVAASVTRIGGTWYYSSMMLYRLFELILLSILDSVGFAVVFRGCRTNAQTVNM